MPKEKNGEEKENSEEPETEKIRKAYNDLVDILKDFAEERNLAVHELIFIMDCVRHATINASIGVTVMLVDIPKTESSGVNYIG